MSFIIQRTDIDNIKKLKSINNEQLTILNVFTELFKVNLLESSINAEGSFKHCYYYWINNLNKKLIIKIKR